MYMDADADETVPQSIVARAQKYWPYRLFESEPGAGQDGDLQIGAQSEWDAEAHL